MTSLSGTVITEQLKAIGAGQDIGYSAAEQGILIASLNHPGRGVERYKVHLHNMSDKTGERFNQLLEAGAQDTAETRLAALKHVIWDDEGYHGDVDTYDDLQNSDLIDVIERRKGLPVALALLFMHVAQENGWDVRPLNFPGHVYMRIDFEGNRLIFDPFDKCKLVEAHDLRAALKKLAGEQAELSASFYEPMSDMDTVLRLQNNRKSRQIMSEDYQAALETIKIMGFLAPKEERLAFETAVMYARLNKKGEAIKTLTDYLERTTSPQDRQDAILLLHELEKDS